MPISATLEVGNILLPVCPPRPGITLGSNVRARVQQFRSSRPAACAARGHLADIGRACVQGVSDTECIRTSGVDVPRTGKRLNEWSRGDFSCKCLDPRKSDERGPRKGPQIAQRCSARRSDYSRSTFLPLLERVCSVLGLFGSPPRVAPANRGSMFDPSGAIDEPCSAAFGICSDGPEGNEFWTPGHMVQNGPTKRVQKGSKSAPRLFGTNSALSVHFRALPPMKLTETTQV